MKRIIGIAVLAASVIIGLYLTGCLGQTVRYSECVVSKARADEIILEREEAVCLIENLIFGEETLFYDDSEGIFYYSLIEGDDDVYDPCIKIESAINDLKIAFLEDGITAQGIKSNETISFLAYTDDVYCTYHLKCTTLPLMNIQCSEEILHDSVPMKMTLFDNSVNAVRRVVYSGGEIRLRGATSIEYAKKGFRFSLRTESVGGSIRPNHISLLNMRQDDDWLLYALGYPIDEKQVCIDENSNDAILYKHGLLGNEGRERLQFTKDGNIFNYLEESPDENMRNQSFLQRYYYNLYTNAGNNEKLYSGIDINNAIDFYLFINLVQGADNVDLDKNYFILLQNEKEGAKAFYAPWDLDLTWEMIFKKYRSLRENKWSEDNINSLLDKYEADIFASGAYLRDMERWSDGTYGSAVEGLNRFRTYVMNRLHETDLYYERLEYAYYGYSSIFIRRSMEYKNFSEYSLIIEINNHNLLLDPDYSAFLEYIGVNVSAITEDIHFILVNPTEKKVEYLPMLYEDEAPRETCIGRLSFTKLREGVYNVKINGVENYNNTSIFSAPEIDMAFIKGTKIYHFDFTAEEYDLQKQRSSFDKLALYVEALSGTNYRAVVEINKPVLWQNADYIALFERLGITQENFHMNTDFIVWNGLEKTAFTLDDFHTSGSSCDTQYGSLSVFENELGEYGVYLDGRECFVSSSDKNHNVDIRIVLLDPESYEIADMITFSDDLW